MKHIPLIISIVIAGLLLLGVYFFITDYLSVRNQVSMNAQNIQAIINFLNKQPTK